jgi:hypothetical protein
LALSFFHAARAEYPGDQTDSEDYSIIVSPSNTTYSSRFLTLHVSAGGALAGPNVKYTIEYAIDAQSPVAMPAEVQQIDSWDRFFGGINEEITLPELTEGSHKITVNLRYVIEPGTPKTANEDTVYFSIVNTASSPPPSSSPTQTITTMLVPSYPNPTSSPSPNVSLPPTISADSLTQQPTLEPIQTKADYYGGPINNIPTLIISAILIAAIVLCATNYVYNRKSIANKAKFSRFVFIKTLAL